MRTSLPNSKRTVRNLVIFSVVVVASGWAGYGLDRLIDNPPDQSLGMLLWLVGPLAAALLLRAFGGDGWESFGLRPALRGNGVWYAVSLLIYPASAALVLAAGAVLGQVAFPGFSLGRLLQIFAAGLLPALVKNIFEEFAWRGYLAPKLFSLELNDYIGYALTGLIWGAWHIPYWLLFLGEAQIQAATGQSLATFVPMAILGLIPASVVYNEIRLLSGSVWPALLLHSVGNALVDGLIAQGLIVVAGGVGALLFAPTHQSLGTMAVFLVAGVWLRRRRLGGQAAAFDRRGAPV